MTEPSQYFKGRTVQEQMDEVIGYVDKRADEVAAAKADAVLQPAEQAKTAAQAAAQAAEAAKDTTLAALPEIQQDISGLKAEDTALDGRLDTVELKVTTAEGNIVTIQGKITAIENKNTQQDSAIAALQTADGQNVKINDVNQYAVGLTGNQDNIMGNKNFQGLVTLSMSRIGTTGSSGYTIVYRFKNTTRSQTLLITGGRTIIMAQVSAAGGYKGQLFTAGRDYKTPSWMWVVTDAATGDHYLVTQGLYSATMNIHVINSFQYGNVYPYQNDIEAVNQSTSDPTGDTRWSSVAEVVNYD